MKKYTHKPIPIIAIQFTGDNMDKVKEFLDKGIYNDYQIIKDHLIKNQFLLFDCDWEERNRANPTEFKQGDYFFTERIPQKSDLLEFRNYLVDFLEKAEFERKYEAKVITIEKFFDQLNTEFKIARRKKDEIRAEKS